MSTVLAAADQTRQSVAMAKPVPALSPLQNRIACRVGSGRGCCAPADVYLQLVIAMQHPRSVLIALMTLGSLTAGLSAQGVPTPIHWWHGDGDAQDSVGTAHGVEMGGVAYAAGLSGMAFSLDGVDDYVALPPAAIPAGDFSVEVWAYYQSLSKPAGSPSYCGPFLPGCDMSLISDMATGNGAGWRVLKQSDSRFWILSNSGQPRAASATLATAGTWFHVVATFENWATASATARVFVDGVLEDTATFAPSQNAVPDVRIGDYAGGAFAYGLIDEVKVYGSALEATDVAAIFAAGAGAGGPGATAPRDVVLLDADNDSDFDAVAANQGSDNVSVWSNDGAGVLTETTVALDPADFAPVAIAAGDLDGDTEVDDVAVACAGSGTVAIVLNVGTAPSASSLVLGGLQPSDVAVGDLDGSSQGDVVVARQGAPLSGGSGIAVSLNGAPFADLDLTGVGATQVVKVVVCDLDGDGDNDLAAVAQGSPDQILLFDGNGLGDLTFADAIDLPTTGLANGLCCGDLDGDGDNDLAVVLPALFPPTSDLRVYTYTGSGTLDAADFAAGSDVATSGSFSVDIACGELDGDSFPGFVSRPDMVVVHAGSGDVEAHYGYDAVASTFVSSSVLAVGSNPIAVAIGDLNGDCVDDVVVVNQGSNDVSVIFGVVGALAQDLGAGCAGTGGLVPALAGIGAPTVGNAGFGTQLSNALAFAPALTMFASTQSTAVLAGGCEVFLGAPISTILRFTDGSGEDSFVFGVPSNPSLLCVELFLQNAVFDASGSFASLLSFSNAVRVRVGS